MDKNEELQKWLNDDRYITAKRLSIMFGLSSSGIWFFLSRHKIKPVKKFALGYSKGTQRFYSLETCLLARHEESVDGIADNVQLVRPVELRQLWNISKETCNSFLRSRGLKPIKRVKVKNIHQAFYDRAECERARPFINQPEQKEVEKVEEKQMESPEPKEQTPDIIPADTIDLFTMSELEAELKNRGVELTAEVRAKINASDMPEMQHIVTMLRGNTKTIAIRLSVLNEIAGQLRESEKKPCNKQKRISVDFFPASGKDGVFYLYKELKPCPFCGSNHIEVSCEELTHRYWVSKILCNGCETRNEHDNSTKEVAAEDLIDFWNRRSCASDDANSIELKNRIENLEYIIANTIKTLQTA